MSALLDAVLALRDAPPLLTQIVTAPDDTTAALHGGRIIAHAAAVNNPTGWQNVYRAVCIRVELQLIDEQLTDEPADGVCCQQAAECMPCGELLCPEHSTVDYTLCSRTELLVHIACHTCDICEEEHTEAAS